MRLLFGLTKMEEFTLQQAGCKLVVLRKQRQNLKQHTVIAKAFRVCIKSDLIGR